MRPDIRPAHNKSTSGAFEPSVLALPAFGGLDGLVPMDDRLDEVDRVRDPGERGEHAVTLRIARDVLAGRSGVGYERRQRARNLRMSATSEALLFERSPVVQRRSMKD